MARSRLHLRIEFFLLQAGILDDTLSAGGLAAFPSEDLSFSVSSYKRRYPDVVRERSAEHDLSPADVGLYNYVASEGIWAYQSQHLLTQIQVFPSPWLCVCDFTVDVELVSLPRPPSLGVISHRIAI